MTLRDLIVSIDFDDIDVNRLLNVDDAMSQIEGSFRQMGGDISTMGRDFGLLGNTGSDAMNEIMTEAGDAGDAINDIRQDAGRTEGALDELGNAGGDAGGDIEDAMDDATDQLGDTEDQADDLGDELERTGKRGEKAGGGLVSAFKKVIVTLAALLAVDKLKDLATGMVEAAGEAQAMNAQFSQVFGDMEGDAQGMLETLGKDFGTLPTRLKPTFTKVTSMFKGFGMTTEESMAAAGNATTLAADAAAFYDISLDDSAGALTSFLKGNTNAAESIGIFATAAGMSSFASKELGLNWKKLDEGGKQLVRLKYVEKMQDAAGATGQAARESDGFENVLGNLQQAWVDLKAKLGEAIFDTAITGMQKVAEWLGNVDTDKIVSRFRTFSNFVTSVFGPILSNLKIGLGELKDSLKTAFQSDAAESALGTLKDGMSWIKENWPTIKETIIGVGVAVLAFKTIMSGMSVIGTVNKLMIAYRTGTLGATLAQMGFNTALLANPLTWIVVGIAALIGVIVYLVRNFDWARDAFGATWEFLKTSFSSVMEWMKPYVSEAMSVVMSAFTTVKEYVGEVMPMIMTIIQTVWSLIAPMFSYYSTLIMTIVSIAFTTIKNVISLVFTSITTIIQVVWTVISGIFKAALQLLTGDFSGAWETMKETTIGAIAGLVKLFDGFVSGAMKIGKDFVQGVIDGFLAVWDSLKETAGKIWDSVTGIFDKKKTIDVDVNANTSGAKGALTKDGSHSSGLSRVPFDGYIAELHKNETVLTASQADAMRSTGVLDDSGIRPKVEPPGKPKPDNRPPPQIGPSGGNNHSEIHFSPEVKIEVTNTGDGKVDEVEISRLVQRELDKMWRKFQLQMT